MGRVCLRQVRVPTNDAPDCQGVEEDAEYEEHQAEQVHVHLEHPSVSLLLSEEKASVVEEGRRDLSDIGDDAEGREMLARVDRAKGACDS